MEKLWCVRQDVYTSDENAKYETIFTLANGYKGIRGTLEFSDIGRKGHFIAGVFDKAGGQVTELVNCQDSLGFNIYVDGEKLDTDRCEILDFDRYLDMKKGLLVTNLELQNQNGKITKIESRRFVSRNNVHRWGATYKISPVNYSDKIMIENIIDGAAYNYDKELNQEIKHLNIEGLYDLGSGIALRTSTKDNGIEIIEGSILKADNSRGNVLRNREYVELGEKINEIYEIEVEENEEYRIEKYCVTYTSRDAESNLYQLFIGDIKDYVYKGLNKELSLHTYRWEKIWDDIDVKIEGDDLAQVGIRFNVYQLYSSAYDGDNRISIGAKALHGEGYRGHVFWDTEIYMLPLFIYTSPKVAKSLLMYRYNMLDGARKNARDNGYKGAQFPWESADDGIEVTPKWGYDFDGSKIRIWTGEEEFHINSDIAFAIWEYYRATDDKDFIINYGMEIFLETARFWESRVEHNEKLDRYEINKVIGPDEFHEHVNNNAYTNYMAKWNMRKALEMAEWMKEEDMSAYKKLISKLGITDKDFNNWENVQDKIYLPSLNEGKLIEEFEGYFNLKDIKITEFDENEMPKWPDLQGYKLSDTQLIKQTDVLLIMLLLGEEFDEETIRMNYDYYEPRTMHKSSLSPSMHSIMGLRVGDTKKAYKYFMKTVLTDLKDNQGNAKNGLHAAATGGSWQSVVFGFGGIYVDDKQNLCFKPWIPEQWDSLSFKLYWRGNQLKINITKKDIIIESQDNIKVKVYDKDYDIEKNTKVVVEK